LLPLVVSLVTAVVAISALQGVSSLLAAWGTSVERVFLHAARAHHQAALERNPSLPCVRMGRLLAVSFTHASGFYLYWQHQEADEMIKPIAIKSPLLSRTTDPLWSLGPVLAKKDGQSFQGRVIVEAWERDFRVVYVGDPSTNRARTLTYLQSLQASTSVASALPTPITATAQFTDQAFLGRVVVELWNQDVVGSIEGTSSLLIVRALEALNDPIEPVEWQS